MATTEDNSTLLGLPMELLLRITAYITPEALTSARLTCKTLEAATFRHFVHLYCTKRRCFVFSTARWTRLQLLLKQSPRLASNVKRIVFTTSPYEHFDHTLLHLAPEQRFKNIDCAQLQAMVYANSNEGFSLWRQENTLPDLPMMVDTISKAKEVSPRVTAECKLELPKEHYVLCRNILAAIAITKLAVSYMSMTCPLAAESEKSLAVHKPDLLACTSSLKFFHFGGQQCEPRGSTSLAQERLYFVTKIIQSSRHITCLSLCMAQCAYFRRPETLTTRLLLSLDSPWLSLIRLHAAAVSEDVLKNFFTKHKCTLKHITLSRVWLRRPSSGWPEIFCTLSAMPLLSKLDLHHLGVNNFGPGYSYIDFESLKHGNKRKGSGGYREVNMHGRDVVLAGVHELLGKPLSYT